jgi:hypothetical protein
MRVKNNNSTHNCLGILSTLSVQVLFFSICFSFHILLIMMLSTYIFYFEQLFLAILS